MSNKKQAGLGKGLDSLIPDYYNKDFDSNDPGSLEDILKENDVEIEEPVEKEEKVEEIIVEEEVEEQPEALELSQKEIDNIKEVKEIVDKNPRITLWSAQSSAVFRYLRKTEPEFSISKEASILIEKAVREKYPDIWKLFDEN